MPETWMPVADALRAGGDDAVVPRLRPPAEALRPWWRSACEDVVAALEEVHADEPVVLVGHSAAGPQLPSIADAMQTAGRTASAVLFVDAGLPSPGRTPRAALPVEFTAHLDAMVGEDGMLPPWSEWWDEAVLAELVPDGDLRRAVIAECRPVPADLYDEPVPVPSGWPASTPCGYFSWTYEADTTEAEARGWLVRRTPGHHLQAVVDPESVAVDLVDLAHVLTR